MSRISIAVSFSINGGISVETSPIKWENPQFFFASRTVLLKVAGANRRLPLFRFAGHEQWSDAAVCTVVLCVLLKKNAPVNRKSPGRILDMGAMARGRA